MQTDEDIDEITDKEKKDEISNDNLIDNNSDNDNNKNAKIKKYVFVLISILHIYLCIFSGITFSLNL